MITYKSDLNIVINKFINDKLSPTAIDNLTSQISNMLKYNNMDRVFNQGIDITNNKIGNYSPKYAKYRAKRNKQTSFINMFFTGQFKNDYKISKIPTGYKIGFNSNRSYNILDGIQNRKNITLVGVSASDKEKITQIVQKFFNKNA